MLRVSVIDSHTGGEPTRVVIAGGPDLDGGTVAERAQVFADRHDSFRSAVVNEPRGSDVLVGALLVEPTDPDCQAGVIFFNNVGVLGMCGHGTIGLVATLRHLGRASLGEMKIETPVGPVTATLHGDGSVSVRNVPSYRTAKGITVEAAGYGPVTGDIAYGGNWFYLVSEHPFKDRLTVSHASALTAYAVAVRQAINKVHPEVDHVELFGPPLSSANDSRNFVLCPGHAYDRSPCGTGTSAKLACLAADGKLAPGQTWRQESVTGSVFEGTIAQDSLHVLPIIRGRAWVNAEATLLIDPDDPLRWGIRGEVIA